MAKERVIEILGGIGQYGCSIDYVKYMMDQLGAGPITAKTTSLGGDVNTALKIKNLFATHGDVTVEYIGFNASASTILGHGAAKTMIHEDSFYLIHKASVPVNPLWGSMNPEEIDQAIVDLLADKKDAETVSLVIAQDYVNSRGMDMKTVMELMIEARWISATEAVALGLVDELIPSTSKKQKSVVTNEMVAMMTANGLPLPTDTVDDEAVKEENLIQRIFNRINPPKPPTQNQMNKDLSFVNQVLAVEGVDVADNKVSMTLEQLTALNTAIKTKNEEVENLTTARDTAVTAQQTSETAMTAFTASVDAIDATVKAAATPEAKVAAITAKLASRPGNKAAAPQGGSSTETVTDSVDWDEMDNMPHNQAADKEYQFTPKTEK